MLKQCSGNVCTAWLADDQQKIFDERKTGVGLVVYGRCRRVPTNYRVHYTRLVSLTLKYVEKSFAAKSRKLMNPSKGSCLLGDGITKSGQKSRPDRCTECACTNSTVTCQRETCPPLNCPANMQTFTSHDQCCPQCTQVANTDDGSCTQNGTVYKVGIIIHGIGYDVRCLYFKNIIR